ncbi:MAG: hypothetical protein AAFX09_01315 [Pseudomonadota bacterium]
MRHLLLASAGAFLLSGCIVVDLGDGHAAVGKQNIVGGDITVTLDEPGDFRVAGSDLDVRGSVAGELHLAGADIVARDLQLGALDAAAADLEFTGNVDGDVSANAADISWRGDVGGRFDANMADGRLDGAFGALRANAAGLHLSSGSSVAGEAYVNAADLVVYGALDGGLDAAVRSSRIHGDVGAPLRIWADPGREPYRRNDGLVEIKGDIVGGFICARHVVITGSVSGPLQIIADEAPEFDGAAVADIEFTPRDGEPCRRSRV